MPRSWRNAGRRSEFVRWLRAIGLALSGVLLVAGPGYTGVLDASWIAPTTNTDGSPLTDLASYRVYYGSATDPCPGSAFSQVASPTPSPGPNTTVSLRLTGLTTGTLYYVAVTAVDLFGNESACSLAAGAVVQAPFTVSPTGSTSFGSVNVGSFADRTFTVQSTRAGTISGAVSTVAPFAIVSGSPFTLSGAGATQTVTVRFTPTTVASATANVTFTAAGDNVSRVVTGVGINPSDTTPPSVTITSPRGTPAYSTTSSPITLAGTASDNVGVTQVTWSNNRGGSGTATGTTNWTASGISLQLGSNVLTVTARDAAGNIGTATLTATLTIAFTFTDDPLIARSTLVQAAHFVELRAAIDSVRTALGLMPFAWTDATLTSSTGVLVVYVTELRTALNEAYRAVGRTAPTYTDPTVAAGLTVIKAVHLNELRAAVRGLP
jgi:hypothetical protein